MRWPWSKDKDVEESREAGEAALEAARSRQRHIDEVTARLRQNLAHNHIAERITRAMGGGS